jgi:O-antigen/teichoic acid export membrane protein
MKARGLKAHFLVNLAGPIVPLAVGLITIPIYVSHIGAARYGFLSITWMLLGYLGFLDLGLSRASANALAKLGHASMQEERAKVLVTSICINLFLGAVVGIIFFFAGTFIVERLLSVPANLKPEIESAFPWVAFVLPLSLIAGLGSGALESRERFFASNVLQVIGTTAGLVVPMLVAVYVSPSLSVVLPAAVIVRCASVLQLLSFALRGEGPLRPRHFDRKRCRALLGYGGWISFNNIAGKILASIDQLMIGNILGVAAVAHYAVPMSLVMRSQLLSGALARTLFPRMSRFVPAEAKKLAHKAVLTLAYVNGALCAPAVVLAGPFLELWMGKEFGGISGPVAQLLLLGAWFSAIGSILYGFLQGQGRPNVTAAIHAIDFAPYVILFWLLTTHFGLLGAAAAWNFLVALDTGLLFFAARFRLAELVKFALPFGFILAGYLYVSFVHPAIVNAVIAACVLGAGVGACALIFDTTLHGIVLTLASQGAPRLRSWTTRQTKTK